MVRPSPDLLARPAVCGHPTSMILTRAHRSSDLLRKRASPGGYFTRALYAVGQNHAGPANVLSGASRLSGLCTSLRPSFGAATTLRLKTKMQAAKTPTVSPRLAPSGAGARRVFLRSLCARRCPIDSLNLIRDKTASRKCRAANWESRHLGGVTKLQRFHRGSFAATQISPRFHRSTASGFWYNVHVPREWGYGAKGRNPMHRKTICAAKRSSGEM